MKEVIRDTVESYTNHESSLLAGALAFYALLATAPFGVFALALVRFFYGEASAREELMHPLSEKLGPEVATFVIDTIQRMATVESTGFASLVGAFFFLLATSKVFVTLRWALNHVWHVRPTVMPGLTGKGRTVLKRRFYAVFMVFICGMLFVAFVIVKTVVVAVTDRFFDVPRVLQLVEFVLSFGLLTGVCALVYRFIPDARIAWEDAMVGAGVTAFLSGLGSNAVGMYLVHFGSTTAYGAAGSLVAFLLWVYYTAQIFLFGAEFTGAWARHRGAGVTPLPYATLVVHPERTSLLEEPPPA